jgi:hypothetical protein
MYGLKEFNNKSNAKNNNKDCCKKKGEINGKRD